MSASPKAISVWLADDHPVVRDGYRRLLETGGEIQVTAEFSDAETLCATYAAGTVDVVILDLNMPGMGGMEAIRRIIAHDAEARILVFSMYDNDIMILRTLEAGATGYLCKDGGAEQMVAAVRAMAKGLPYMDANHATDLVFRQSRQTADPLKALSSREFQLFQLFAEGRSIAHIAEDLSISPKTVAVHQSNIMRKLALSNNTELVRLAIRCQVIPP